MSLPGSGAGADMWCTRLCRAIWLAPRVRAKKGTATPGRTYLRLLHRGTGRPCLTAHFFKAELLGCAKERRRVVTKHAAIDSAANATLAGEIFEEGDLFGCFVVAQGLALKVLARGCVGRGPIMAEVPLVR